MAADDQSWRGIYASMDTTTLLALLPVLRASREKVQQQAEHHERNVTNMEGSDAYTAQLFGETLAALNARLTADDVDGREGLKELRNTVQKIMGDQIGRTAEWQADDRMWRWLWDHQQREAWIVEELGRRKILPVFSADAE